jgi:Protein of unknown function (DUF1194)
MSCASLPAPRELAMEPDMPEALRTIGAESVRAPGLARRKGGNLLGFAGARKSMAAASCFLAAAMLGLMGLPAGAADLPVDLELVLAVDASPSIGIPEFFIQRRGYVAAFRDPRLIDAIRAGHYGRIAVTYVEWAGPASQRVVVPWMLIDGAESAAGFASLLETARSYQRLGTSISGALAYAYYSFGDNGFAGERRAIDISGNGPNSVGPPIGPIRDAIVARGVTINGLPLVLSPGQASLDNYYRHCVIGGLGAFVVTVLRPEAFEAAIRAKLIREVAARSTEEAAPVLRVSDAGGRCDG